jgi:protein tyrosine/serine phosphatase
MLRFLALLILLSSTVFTSISFAGGEPPTRDPVFAEDLPNYMVVNQQISRSGRPTFTGLKMLKDMGIKTIIDIENNDQVISREKSAAQKMGFRFFSSPMDWESRPNDRQVQRILEALQDKSLQPILLHCMHGRDRTGLIIGLYRVFVDKWQPKKAYEEMLADGFNPELTYLDRYFKEKTR